MEHHPDIDREIAEREEAAEPVTRSLPSRICGKISVKAQGVLFGAKSGLEDCDELLEILEDFGESVLPPDDRTGGALKILEGVRYHLAHAVQYAKEARRIINEGGSRDES